MFSSLFSSFALVNMRTTRFFFVSLFFFRGVDVCISIPETLKQLIAPFVCQVAPHSLVAFIFYFKGLALERRRRRIRSTGGSVAAQTHQASREGEGHSRSKRGRWRTAVYSRCCEGGSKKLVFCVLTVFRQSMQIDCSDTHCLCN